MGIVCLCPEDNVLIRIHVTLVLQHNATPNSPYALLARGGTRNKICDALSMANKQATGSSQQQELQRQQQQQQQPAV